MRSILFLFLSAFPFFLGSVSQFWLGSVETSWSPRVWLGSAETRSWNEIQSLSWKEEKTRKGGILPAEGGERFVFYSLLAKTNLTRYAFLSPSPSLLVFCSLLLLLRCLNFYFFYFFWFLRDWCLGRRSRGLDEDLGILVMDFNYGDGFLMSCSLMKQMQLESLL